MLKKRKLDGVPICTDASLYLTTPQSKAHSCLGRIPSDNDLALTVTQPCLDKQPSSETFSVNLCDDPQIEEYLVQQTDLNSFLFDYSSDLDQNATLVQTDTVHYSTYNQNTGFCLASSASLSSKEESVTYFAPVYTKQSTVYSQIYEHVQPLDQLSSSCLEFHAPGTLPSQETCIDLITPEWVPLSCPVSLDHLYGKGQQSTGCNQVSYLNQSFYSVCMPCNVAPYDSVEPQYWDLETSSEPLSCSSSPSALSDTYCNACTSHCALHLDESTCVHLIHHYPCDVTSPWEETSLPSANCEDTQSAFLAPGHSDHTFSPFHLVSDTLLLPDTNSIQSKRQKIECRSASGEHLPFPSLFLCPVSTSYDDGIPRIEIPGNGSCQSPALCPALYTNSYSSSSCIFSDTCLPQCNYIRGASTETADSDHSVSFTEYYSKVHFERSSCFYSQPEVQSAAAIPWQMLYAPNVGARHSTIKVSAPSISLSVSSGIVDPVDWVLYCSQSLQLKQQSTIFLALHLIQRSLESFTDSRLIHPTSGQGVHLQTLVLRTPEFLHACCLCIAAKLEECRHTVPILGVLCSLLNARVSDLYELEIWIMQLLDWRPYFGFDALNCT